MNDEKFICCVFTFRIGKREVDVFFRQTDDGLWAIEATCPMEGRDILWDPLPKGSRPRSSPCLSRALALAKEACEAWDE